MSNMIKMNKNTLIKILTLYKYSRNIIEFLRKKTLKPEQIIIEMLLKIKYQF
jgi:hypothetical protein